jgi:hypothetical protein
MKKFLIFGALVVVILALFFVRTYTSSPGFTTQEAAGEFYATSPKCQGISFLLNAEATYADAPGKSLCIGLLK